MYGAFTTHPGFADNPGIPSGDYKVTLQGAQSAAPYRRSMMVTLAWPPPSHIVWRP